MQAKMWQHLIWNVYIRLIKYSLLVIDFIDDIQSKFLETLKFSVLLNAWCQYIILFRTIFDNQRIFGDRLYRWL